MTKYLIVLLVLIGAGGAFLYTSQTVQAPTVNPEASGNPFGEGSQAVGTVESTDGAHKDEEDEHQDEAEHDQSASTGGSTTEKGSTGSTGSTGTTGSTPAGGTVDGGTTATPGVISRAELAKHSTQADCWIGYKGTVYDVTNWLPRHPGSAGAIAPYCGTADEFATAFNRRHGTSKDAKLQKEGVKEGTLGN